MALISIGALSGQEDQEEMQKLAVQFNSAMDSKNYAWARSLMQHLLTTASGELASYLQYVLSAVPQQQVASKPSRGAAVQGSRGLTQSTAGKTRRNLPSYALAVGTDGNGRLNLNQYIARNANQARSSPYISADLDKTSYRHNAAGFPMYIPVQSYYNGFYYTYYQQLQQYQLSYQAFQSFDGQPYQTMQYTHYQRNALPHVIQPYPPSYPQLQPVNATFPPSYDERMQHIALPQFYSQNTKAESERFSSNLEQEQTDEQILQEILGEQYAQIKQLYGQEIHPQQYALRPYTMQSAKGAIYVNYPPIYEPPLVCAPYYAFYQISGQFGAGQPDQLGPNRQILGRQVFNQHDQSFPSQQPQPYPQVQPLYYQQQPQNTAHEQLDLAPFATPQLSKVEIPQTNMEQLIGQARQFGLFGTIEAVMTNLLNNYQFAQILMTLCQQISGLTPVCSKQPMCLRGCLNYVKVHSGRGILNYLTAFVKQQCNDLIMQECRYLSGMTFADHEAVVGVSEFVSKFAVIKLMVVQ